MDTQMRLENMLRTLRTMQRTVQEIRATVANTPRMAHLASELEKTETAIRRTMAAVEGRA